MIIPMRSRLATLLRLHRPRLKAEWRRLLWMEPVSTPLANPDTLVYLMDETLTQLESILRTQHTPRWLKLRKTHLEPLRSYCPCGLNPLLAYFSTGVEALDTVLTVAASLTKEEKAIFYQGWHFLAQGEIQALCGGCCQECRRPKLSFSLAEKG
jgi:hypothetical protein